MNKDNKNAVEILLDYHQCLDDIVTGDIIFFKEDFNAVDKISIDDCIFIDKYLSILKPSQLKPSQFDYFKLFITKNKDISREQLKESFNNFLPNVVFPNLKELYVENVFKAWIEILSKYFDNNLLGDDIIDLIIKFIKLLKIGVLYYWNEYLDFIDNYNYDNPQKVLDDDYDDTVDDIVRIYHSFSCGIRFFILIEIIKKYHNKESQVFAIEIVDEINSLNDKRVFLNEDFWYDYIHPDTTGLEQDDKDYINKMIDTVVSYTIEIQRMSINEPDLGQSKSIINFFKLLVFDYYNTLENRLEFDLSKKERKVLDLLYDETIEGKEEEIIYFRDSLKPDDPALSYLYSTKTKILENEDNTDDDIKSIKEADVDEWFGEIDEFFDDYMKIKQLAERLSEEGYFDKSSIETFILRVSGYKTTNKVVYDIRWRGEDRDLYFLHKLLLGRFEGFTSYKNGSIDWKYGKLKDYFKGPDFIDCHLKCNRCSKEMKSILEDIFGLTISFTGNKGNISIRKPEESKE